MYPTPAGAAHPKDDPLHDSNRDVEQLKRMGNAIPSLQLELKQTTASEAKPFLQKLEALAVSYLQTSHYQEAIAACNQLEASLVPLSIRSSYVRATALRELQNYDEAEKNYRRAVEALSDLDLSTEENKKIKIDLLRDFGILFLIQKKYNEAREIFTQAAKACNELKFTASSLALHNYAAMAQGLAKEFLPSLEQLKDIRTEWMEKPQETREKSMDFGSHLYHSARVRGKYAKHLHATSSVKEANEQLGIAITDLKESIRIREQVAGATTINPIYVNSRVADPCWLLGKILISMGNNEEGRSFLTRAKTCYDAMEKEPARLKAKRIQDNWLSIPPKRTSLFFAKEPQQAQPAPPPVPSTPAPVAAAGAGR